ncbi:MAG: type II secretion system protein [Gammaproteobacteria bacterium]|nr:type II secretion system protein [Gammaproteobacteria bacterium]
MTTQSGFTLIELLIVLVILGFSSSMIAPNLWRTHEKSQQRDTLQKFVLALNKYRIKAYNTGKMIEFTQKQNTVKESNLATLPKLPEGWAIKEATTLRFLPTGVTNGATYQIDSPNKHWQLTINPLDGQHEIQLL